jgi:NADH:ubiquinone oxidoreductase subunit D
MCTIINTNRRRNNDYFDRSLTRRQKVSQGQRIIKSDNNKTKRPKTRRSNSNTVTEQPKAIMSQSDQEAFQTHFGNNVEDFQKGFLIQRIDRNE